MGGRLVNVMKGDTMKEHPVVRARKPFGLFMDILDFRLMAVDGKPVKEGETNSFVRLDSKGRVFVKSESTDGLWERIPWPPAKAQCACGLPLNMKHPTPPKANVLRGDPPKE